MSVHGHDGLQEVKCALYVANDLPAASKVCGFLGHSAHIGWIYGGSVKKLGNTLFYSVFEKFFLAMTLSVGDILLAC